MTAAKWAAWDNAPPRRGASLPAFASCGRDVTVWPLAKIRRPKAISIGDHVIIDDFVFLDGGRRTTIGSYVHISVGVVITGGGELRVGSFTCISSGARIYTGTDDVVGHLVGPTIPDHWRGVSRPMTTIGDHVTVLALSVVPAGCVVPDGVVIAPGAVVPPKLKLEPWTVYGGVPARPLSSRESHRQGIYRDAVGLLIERRE